MTKLIKLLADLIAKFLIAAIIIIVILFFSCLSIGCSTPDIVVKQKAVCVYSDSMIARFAYRRIEHLNKVTTIYESAPGNYKVGRTYIVIILP